MEADHFPFIERIIKLISSKPHSKKWSGLSSPSVTDSFKCRNFLVHAPLFQQLWLVRFDFNHLTAGFDFIWFFIFY